MSTHTNTRYAITSGRSDSALAVVAYIDNAYDAGDALNRYADVLEAAGRPAYWDQDADGRDRLDVADAEFPFYAKPVDALSAERPYGFPERIDGKGIRGRIGSA